MIFNRTTVQTNPEGEEYPEDGLKLFDLRYVRPLMRSGMPFIRLDRRADTACFDAFERAFHACEEERPGYEFKIRAELSAILLLLGRRAPAAPPAAGQVQQARLKQILGWIDRHLENPITLRDLAGCAGVSPRECQRMFRRYLHCRPMEYLCQRRLLVAAEQLAATSFPVTEIALQCGFSSPSYFSKQFKRLVGQTPAAYRAGQRQP